MAIKVGEVGKPVNYPTTFDLSASSEMTLKFKSPKGVVQEFTQTGGRVTAPAAELTNEPVIQADGSIINQTVPGGTYMQITTTATDFIEEGDYTICGTYEDATPKEFFGDENKFPVGAAC